MEFGASQRWIPDRIHGLMYCDVGWSLMISLSVTVLSHLHPATIIWVENVDAAATERSKDRQLVDGARFSQCQSLLPVRTIFQVFLRV